MSYVQVAFVCYLWTQEMQFYIIKSQVRGLRRNARSFQSDVRSQQCTSTQGAQGRATGRSLPQTSATKRPTACSPQRPKRRFAAGGKVRAGREARRAECSEGVNQ